MAFHPLFRLGAPSGVSTGPRSLLAFWMGGASAPSDVTPEPEPTPGDGGGRIVGGHFSRGKWRDIQRKRWEELEAAIKAEEAARGKERLQAAADLAAEAIAAAEEEGESAQVNFDLVRMTNALEAAISAKRATHAIKKADLAMRYAQALIDMEDEDEIVMLLLS